MGPFAFRTRGPARWDPDRTTTFLLRRTHELPEHRRVRSRARILIGVAGVLLVLAVAVFFFFRHQVRKSFPVVDGSVRVGGLTAPVEVYRDEFGVPLISATTEHDLMAAIGYAHAQDRLWQMDLARRASQGRLSELFGRETVEFDHFFRVVGLRRAADSIMAHLDASTLERLAWYSEGVNAYIESAHGKHPVEFDLLRYDPEPWEPVHSILAARLIAWELNLSWWTDITLGAIAERVGLLKAVDIMPAYPQDVAPAVQQSSWRKQIPLALGFVRTGYRYAQAFGGMTPGGGSNAWAVSSRRSETGHALLANDTHLHLSAPSMWYEMVLKGGGYEVRGMSLPGAPGIIAGRNGTIAWGITNLMADEADFFVERLDSVSGTTSEHDGKWLPIRSWQEDILVRDDTLVTVTIRATRNGPIVSDVHTRLQRSRTPFTISMRWTGYETDDPIGTLLALNRAASWEEFNRALDGFTVPGQNFVYADVEGVVGYRVAVRLPIRSRTGGLLPLPGWDPASDWKGYVPPGRLPRIANPPEGFVASANNKVTDDSYPYPIGDLWEPPARIQRLRSLLAEQGEEVTIADFERWQNDRISPLAMELMPHLLRAGADSAFGFPDKERVFEYLRNWNYAFDRDDIPSSIFHPWLVHLIRNTFRDEMGDDLFHDYVLLVNVPLRAIARLMNEEQSPWFDDVTTEAVESRDDIIRASLIRAVADVRERLGDDPRRWRWGALHQAEFQHPFGLRKPLDVIFNVGPFQFGGASTALMSGEYSLNTPYEVTVGPSFRQIFELGGPGTTRVVLPPGQSGHAFHRHYDDQAQLWLNGAYRTASSDPRSGRWSRLTLEPAR
jgi:penicillin amidase